MDLSKIIAELRIERDVLEEAIASLERLTETRRPRGRPAATPVDVQPEALHARAASAGGDEPGSAG